MIIKMTVHDNDFAEFLESFAKNLKAKMICNDNSTRDDRCKTVDIFSKSANDEVLTDEDESFICSQVNEIFSKYLSQTYFLNEETKHYLISNFCVEIVDSFQEKWENGECVYYFSNSIAVIAQ